MPASYVAQSKKRIRETIEALHSSGFELRSVGAKFTRDGDVVLFEMEADIYRDQNHVGHVEFYGDPRNSENQVDVFMSYPNECRPFILLEDTALPQVSSLCTEYKTDEERRIFKESAKGIRIPVTVLTPIMTQIMPKYSETGVESVHISYHFQHPSEDNYLRCLAVDPPKAPDSDRLIKDLVPGIEYQEDQQHYCIDSDPSDTVPLALIDPEAMKRVELHLWLQDNPSCIELLRDIPLMTSSTWSVTGRGYEIRSPGSRIAFGTSVHSEPSSRRLKKEVEKNPGRNPYSFEMAISFHEAKFDGIERTVGARLSINPYERRDLERLQSAVSHLEGVAEKYKAA